ncbi:MAG: InlB B-repeat-containing protein [Clostridia bacterium]|nr:InlB B-repeat-containing protein [Clostridia bacterium]
MTKTVYKIMLICALVLILPLAIVGSVLIITTADDIDINVGYYIDSDEALKNKAIDAYVKVLVDGEEETELTMNKSEDVTFSVKVKGYKFLGWYVGDEDSYNANKEPEFISTKPEITLKAYQYPKLTAVCNIIRYEVEYAEDLEVENFDRTSLKTNLVYGESLDSLDDLRGTDYYFAGWTIGASGAEIYQRATFPEVEDINLYPKWEETRTIKYFYQDELLSSRQIGDTIYYTQRDLDNGNIEMLDVNDLTQYNVPLPQAGYYYDWSNSVDTYSQAVITVFADHRLYLYQVPYTYKVSVNSNGATYVGAEDLGKTDVMKFEVNVQNIDEELGIYISANWNKTNYSLKGFTFNNTVYPSATELLQAINDAYPTGTNSTIEVSLSWEYDFTSLEITNAMYYRIWNKNTETYVYNEDKEAIDDVEYKVTISEEYMDDRLVDYILNSEGNKFYIDDLQSREVKLCNIVISINSNENQYAATAQNIKDFTVRDLMNWIATIDGVTLTNGGFVIDHIILYFN